MCLSGACLSSCWGRDDDQPRHASVPSQPHAGPVPQVQVCVSVWLAGWHGGCITLCLKVLCQVGCRHFGALGI